MVYINFTKDYYEKFINQSKFPKIISSMLYYWKIAGGDFFCKKIENGEILFLPRLNQKFKKKLLKYLNIYSIKTVCISKNLFGTDIEREIKRSGIYVLDGSWLYKYLIRNIVEYVIQKRNTALNNQEISFLCKDISDIEIENIMFLSEKCKQINIITQNTNRIKRLEEYLYKQKGIALNITQNYEKSLIKSNIIINVDLDEEEFNKYNLPRKAVIINIKNRVKIMHKGFDGINVFSYKIVMPKKYLTEDLNLDSFCKETLYESYIYKKTSPKNILREIEMESLKIEALTGVNGNMKNSEYKRLEKNA